MLYEVITVHTLFGDELDGILDHTRPIVNPCDDSVVHLAGKTMRTLRLARGYAPLSRRCDSSGSPLMAIV